MAASRKTTGNHPLYAQLEASLRQYFKVSEAVFVSTGFLATLTAGEALSQLFSHIFIDEKAHPSLWLAAREIGGAIRPFAHCDPQDLQKIVRRQPRIRKAILLTDGIFSFDGRIAPLRDYLHVLPEGATFLIDDAHGLGVLGDRGCGSLEHFGLSRQRIIQTGSLGKAFGVYGGVVLASKQISRAIWSKSRTFGSSTPLPLPLVGACIESIKIMKETGSILRKRLQSNIAYFKSNLQEAQIPVPDDPTPIFSVVPKSKKEAALLSKTLRNAGINPPFIHYPGGPASGFFRFAVSSEHSKHDLDRLIAVLSSD